MKILQAALSLLVIGSPQFTHAADLDWLIGCWETSDKSSMEVWVKDTDGDLLGFSVTVRDSEVVFYEVLRITELQDGSVTYSAHPAGQAATTFTAAKVSGTEVTFANPAHDYPQEISYQRDGSVLLARISALDGKKPRSFDKQSCE